METLIDEEIDIIESIESDTNNWIDRHSVNCYICGRLVDERDCIRADEFNGGDGGDICIDCQENI
jgi:hypothetical protein